MSRRKDRISRTLGWCISCDMAYVGSYEKCPSCGARKKRSRAKIKTQWKREIETELTGGEK